MLTIKNEFKSILNIDEMTKMTIVPYTSLYSIGKFILSFEQFNQPVTSVYCTIQNLITIFNILNEYYNIPLDDIDEIESKRDVYREIQLTPTIKYDTGKIVLSIDYATEYLMFEIYTYKQNTMNQYGVVILNDNLLDILYGGLEYIITSYGEMITNE